MFCLFVSHLGGPVMSLHGEYECDEEPQTKRATEEAPNHNSGLCRVNGKVETRNTSQAPAVQKQRVTDSNV